jgi:hypothetical protein
MMGNKPAPRRLKKFALSFNTLASRLKPHAFSEFELSDRARRENILDFQRLF